nr:BrxE family protein [Candidatus Desulfatibia profunda]
MARTDLKEIVKLRVCVGFLGESQQCAWWQSSFFSPMSSAYLSPVFGKTSFSAQYYGIKEAATRVHDEHIGIGKGVFHLFRLHEMHEIELHRLLEDKEIIGDAGSIVSGRGSAERFLKEYAIDPGKAEVGPVRVGDNSDIA